MKKHINHAKAALPVLRTVWKWILANKFIVAAGLVLILLFVLYTKPFKALLVLAVFGVASSTVTVYKRFIRMPPVFELISLTATLVTLFFGPVVAIIYTSIVNLAAEVFSGYPDVMTLTYIPSRAVQVLTAFALSSFTDMGIVGIGVWSVVVFNLVEQPIFMLLASDTEQRLKAIYFTVFNVPLNFMVFSILGEFMQDILTAIL